MVGLVGGDHVKTGHGIPSRIQRILGNIGFPNSRTASVALNPSWKLYSNSRTLVKLKNVEDASSQSGAIKLASVSGQRPEEADDVPQGWQSPPPADHHPFSDIIWFS